MGLFVHIVKNGDAIKSIGSNAGDRSTLDPSGPPPTIHHFKKQWVINQIDRENATLSKGQLVLHTEDHGDVAYKVNRTPGAYCTNTNEDGTQVCGDRVAEGPARSIGMVRSRQEFIDSCSFPVKRPPEVIHFYDCELING